MSREPLPPPETPGQLLERMGVDARIWADEWHRNARLIYERDGITALLGTASAPADTGWMIGWFANALEAGRTAGRREACTHPSGSQLSGDLWTCDHCGRLFDQS